MKMALKIGDFLFCFVFVVQNKQWTHLSDLNMFKHNFVSVNKNYSQCFIPAPTALLAKNFPRVGIYRTHICIVQKVHASHRWQKGITDILIIWRFNSFVMGERHVINNFVLQAVEL